MVWGRPSLKGGIDQETEELSGAGGRGPETTTGQETLARSSGPWYDEQNLLWESGTMKYVCPCGYEYDPAVGDPDSGIAPGTAWEDVPADWVCPVCGLGKDDFTPAE